MIRMPIAGVLPIVLLGVLMSGCETPPTQTGKTLENITQTLEEGAAQAKAPPAAGGPPPEVSAALLPPISPQRPSAQPPAEPRFDVVVNKAPAQQFFMSLVEGTPYNMVVHPQVSGEISLNLKNVTVPEVMEAVRDVYGYDFQRAPSGYRVLPATMQSRTFKIDYLTVERLGRSQTRVNSGQIAGSVNNSGGNTNTGSNNAGGIAGLLGGGPTTTGSDGGQGLSGSGTSGSQIDTSSRSDFWTELEVALKTIVGTEGGRSVVVSPQSGVVIARALPDELRAVDDFLKLTQTSIGRSVILEAKILEVELSDGFQSGINWSLLGQPGENQSVTLGQLGGGASVFSATGVANATSIFPAAAGIFSLALALNDFNAFIELLRSQGEVQVLSSPRVSTVNNQKAVIKVGSDDFFVTNVSTTTVTGTTTVTNPNITLTPFFSGIALDVTPQISEAGDVILHIHPTVSEVRDRSKTLTVGGVTQTLPLASSSVRESDSIIRAKDGQLVVIGGLIQDTTRNDQSQPPVLGDIPGVGAAFQHRRQAGRKSELVILLKPTVVDEEFQWSQTLRESAESFKKFKREP